MSKLIWLLTFILSTLGFISIAKDNLDIWDQIIIVLWSISGPLVFASIYQLTKKMSLFLQCICLSAFFSNATLGFYFIGETASLAIKSESLGEAMILLAYIPFGYVTYGSIGFLVGVVIYLSLILYRKYAKQTH